MKYTYYMYSLMISDKWITIRITITLNEIQNIFITPESSFGLLQGHTPAPTLRQLFDFYYLRLN